MANEGKLPRALVNMPLRRCAASKIGTAHLRPWHTRQEQSSLKKSSRTLRFHGQAQVALPLTSSSPLFKDSWGRSREHPLLNGKTTQPSLFWPSQQPVVPSTARDWHGWGSTYCKISFWILRNYKRCQSATWSCW
jgi:hypothetical protein